MPKPSSLPGWFPTNPAKIIEPSAGFKDAGFDPEFSPPAQWFNWFWDSVSRWLAWLDSASIQGDDIGDTDASVSYAATPDPEYTLYSDDTGAAEEYARLQASNLYLREGGVAAPAYRFGVEVPAGWTAAAAADHAVQVPDPTLLANFTMAQMAPFEVGSWTPTVSLSGTTYTTQIGWYQRIGHIVHAYFRVAWNGGTAAGDLEIGGLSPTPGVSTNTIGGFPYPYQTTASPYIGTAWDNSASEIGALHLRFSAGFLVGINVQNLASSPPPASPPIYQEYAPGDLYGFVTYALP